VQKNSDEAAAQDESGEAPAALANNGEMFESVVFKGRMLKRTYSTNSQLHSR
jgi:hypothetical protein